MVVLSAFLLIKGLDPLEIKSYKKKNVLKFATEFDQGAFNLGSMYFGCMIFRG